MADSIPNYPQVSIQLYDEHNGEVRIAGSQYPVVHEDAREACKQVVVEKALELGRPLRVTAQEPDGTTWPMIISPDGDVEPLDVSKKKRNWLPIVLAGASSLLLILATTVYFVFVRDTTPKPPESPYLPAAPPPELRPDTFAAREPPPGFSRAAAWTADLKPDSRPVVSPDQKNVALVTQDNRIVLLDAFGRVLWQDSQTKKASEPAFGVIDGMPSVWVVDEDRMRWWSVTGLKPREAKVPDGFKVEGFGGSTPIAVNEPRSQAHIIRAGSFVQVQTADIERNATVLLGDNQSVLLGNKLGTIWWATPDAGPAPLKLKAPASGYTPVSVRASPRRIIIVWQNARDDSVQRAVIYEWRTGAVRASAGPTKERFEQADWTQNGDGTMGALGPYLFDMRGSPTKPKRLQDFKPVAQSGAVVYGAGKASGLMVDIRTGRSSMYASDAAVPWGIVGGLAVLLESDTVYALRPI